MQTTTGLAAKPPLRLLLAFRDEPQTFLSTADFPAAFLGSLPCLTVTALNSSGVLAVQSSQQELHGEKKKRGKTLQSSKEPRAHGQSLRPTVPWEDGTTLAAASDKRDFCLRRAGEWRGSYESGQSTAVPGEALRPVRSMGQGQLRAPVPGQPPLSPAGCRSGPPSPNTRFLRLGAESWPAPTAHLQVAAPVPSALPLV